MKTSLKLIFALITLLPLAYANAETYSEDQVLHAVFVAFQPVDIYSAHEIKASRELLFVAAAEGNPEAMQVLGGLPSFANFYEKAPKKAQITLVEQVFGKKAIAGS